LKGNSSRILRSAKHWTSRLRAAKWLCALWIAAFLLTHSLCLAQTQSPQSHAEPQAVPAPSAQQAQSSTNQAAPDQPLAASISGIILDPDGALVANVKVTLSQPAADGGSPGAVTKRDTLSGPDGDFVFANVSPGPFQLSFTGAGFAPLEKSGDLHAGENLVFSQIALLVARNEEDVEVRLTQQEVAQDQIKVEEKQRVLGFIPNYYVSYTPHAAPLTPRLKFQLALKTVANPYTFAITGGVAGIEQADDAFSGYGQGVQGYAKRYAAAYADLVTGTFIGGALLPSLLKQDPRFFYKGTGSVKSRIFYALAMSVVCKGDNGHWQPDYSGIIGGLAAGGISNLYYPVQNRNGAALTFENALIGIAGSAAGNLLQEFVVRRFTRNVPPQDPGKP